MHILRGRPEFAFLWPRSRPGAARPTISRPRPLFLLSAARGYPRTAASLLRGVGMTVMIHTLRGQNTRLGTSVRPLLRPGISVPSLSPRPLFLLSGAARSPKDGRRGVPWPLEGRMKDRRPYVHSTPTGIFVKTSDTTHHRTPGFRELGLAEASFPRLVALGS